MAKLSTDELLDAFKEMTLLELSDFVKLFEETFDVTAAAPVAVAAAGRGSAPAETSGCRRPERGPATRPAHNAAGVSPDTVQVPTEAQRIVVLSGQSDELNARHAQGEVPFWAARVCRNNLAGFLLHQSVIAEIYVQA